MKKILQQHFEYIRNTFFQDWDIAKGWKIIVINDDAEGDEIIINGEKYISIAVKIQHSFEHKEIYFNQAFQEFKNINNVRYLSSGIKSDDISNDLQKIYTIIITEICRIIGGLSFGEYWNRIAFERLIQVAKKAKELGLVVLYKEIEMEYIDALFFAGAWKIYGNGTKDTQHEVRKWMLDANEIFSCDLGFLFENYLISGGNQ